MQESCHGELAQELQGGELAQELHMQESCQKIGMGIVGGWVVLAVCCWLRIGLRVRRY